MALQSDESVGAANSAALGNVLPVFRLDHAGKRLADIVAATIGLVLFSPLFLITAIAIKLDAPGAVLIREGRYGYRNRPIQILKFRMVEDCAETDPRRRRPTRIGRLLSQTGIDELPQLINVLRGEMSIIGRPPSPRPKATLSAAKPGMIRWAQIIATRESPGADPH